MGNAWLEVGKKFLAANNSRLQVIESGQIFRPLPAQLGRDDDLSYERLTNVQGTFAGGAYPFSTVPLGPLGYNWATNYTATGSETKFVEVVTPGLFTWNSDGTVTAEYWRLPCRRFHSDR